MAPRSFSVCEDTLRFCGSHGFVMAFALSSTTRHDCVTVVRNEVSLQWAASAQTSHFLHCHPRRARRRPLSSRVRCRSGFSASGVMGIQQMIMSGGLVETAIAMYSDFENYDGGTHHHVLGSNVGGHANYRRLDNYFRNRFGEGVELNPSPRVGLECRRPCELLASRQLLPQSLRRGRGVDDTTATPSAYATYSKMSPSSGPSRVANL